MPGYIVDPALWVGGRQQLSRPLLGFDRHWLTECWSGGVMGCWEQTTNYLSFKSFCCTSFQHSSTPILHKCGASSFKGMDPPSSGYALPLPLCCWERVWTGITSFLPGFLLKNGSLSVFIPFRYWHWNCFDMMHKGFCFVKSPYVGVPDATVATFGQSKD